MDTSSTKTGSKMTTKNQRRGDGDMGAGHVGRYISLANNDFYSNLACHFPSIIVFGTLLVYLIVGFYNYPLFLHLFFFLAVWIAAWLLYIATFSILGWWKMRKCCEVNWERELNREMMEKKVDLSGVLHFVILPNYKEDESMLSTTIMNLASNSMLAKFHMVVVIACEAREGQEVRDKAERLIAKHSGHFKDMIASFHPSGIANEVKGKSSNTQWAFRECQKYYGSMVSSSNTSEDSTSFTDLSKIFLTICDADSLLHKNYFSKLTLKALTEQNQEERAWSVYQTPILQYRNIENSSSFVRNTSYGEFMFEISGLASSQILDHFSFSCYSLTLALANHPIVDGWDRDVIAEDHHMFVKCLCADYWEKISESSGDNLALSRLRIQPIWLPTNSYLVEDSSINLDEDDYLEYQDSNGVAYQSVSGHEIPDLELGITSATSTTLQADDYNTVGGNTVGGNTVGNAVGVVKEDSNNSSRAKTVIPTQSSSSRIIIIPGVILTTLFNRLMSYSKTARKLNRQWKFTTKNLYARYLQARRHMQGLAEFSYIVLQYFSLCREFRTLYAQKFIPLSVHMQFIHMSLKYLTITVLNSLHTFILVLGTLGSGCYIMERLLRSEIKNNHVETILKIIEELRNNLTYCREEYFLLNIMITFVAVVFPLAAFFVVLSNWLALKDGLEGRFYDLYTTNYLVVDHSSDKNSDKKYKYDNYMEYKYDKYEVDSNGNHILLKEVEIESGIISGAMSYRDQKIMLSRNDTTSSGRKINGLNNKNLIEKLSTRKMTLKMQLRLFIQIYYELNILGQVSLILFSVIPLFQAVVELSRNGHRFDYVVAAKPSTNNTDASSTNGANNVDNRLRKSSKELLVLSKSSKEIFEQKSSEKSSISDCSTVAIYASRIYTSTRKIMRDHSDLFNKNDYYTSNYYNNVPNAM